MTEKTAVRAVCVAVIVLFCWLEGECEEGQTVCASGVGFAPLAYRGTARGRLMAERAAKIVAARNLAKRIDIIPRTGSFTVFLPGVRVVESVRVRRGGIRVTVEMMVKSGRNEDCHEWGQ